MMKIIVDKLTDHKPPGETLKISTLRGKIKFKTFYKGDKNPI